MAVVTASGLNIQIEHSCGAWVSRASDNSVWLGLADIIKLMELSQETEDAPAAEPLIDRVMKTWERLNQVVPPELTCGILLELVRRGEL